MPEEKQWNKTRLMLQWDKISKCIEENKKACAHEKQELQTDIQPMQTVKAKV